MQWRYFDKHSTFDMKNMFNGGIISNSIRIISNCIGKILIQGIFNYLYTNDWQNKLKYTIALLSENIV